MAKKKDFGSAAAGLFTQSPKENTTEAQDAQKIQEVQQEQEDHLIYMEALQEVQQVQIERSVRPTADNIERIEGTQGKKGQKLKRHNMGFTDANHEFLRRKSRQLGVTMTEYVNCLITIEREGEC